MAAVAAVTAKATVTAVAAVAALPAGEVRAGLERASPHQQRGVSSSCGSFIRCDNYIYCMSRDREEEKKLSKYFLSSFECRRESPLSTFSYRR